MTVGTVTAGDVRLEQIATPVAPRRGGTPAVRARRGTCALASPGRASARGFRCSVRLPGGRWRIVTRAFDATSVVGQGVRLVRVRGAAVAEAVTG